MPNLDMVVKALDFATEAHRGQVRKYTCLPYVTHCFEVMTTLQDHGVEDVDVLCAGLLHDTVEDTIVTLDQIENIFGERVSRLVGEVTKVTTKSDGTRDERLAKEIHHLSHISFEGKMVKIADIISNTSTIASLDRSFARVYLAEKDKTLSAIGIDHPLYETAIEVVSSSLLSLSVRASVVQEWIQADPEIDAALYKDMSLLYESSEHAFDHKPCILRAAIRSSTGRIYHLPKPNRHHNILHQFYPEVSQNPHDQGFLTSQIKWVDRKDGLSIAIAAGQIIKKHPPENILFSEDLW